MRYWVSWVQRERHATNRLNDPDRTLEVNEDDYVRITGITFMILSVKLPH